MRVPLVDLKAQYQAIREPIDAAVRQVIAESAFIGGRFVKAFEAEFAKLYGVKHVIPCGNGTDSLYILMKMLGIGPGDEVITPSNSWISSAETITQVGARVVFADVHPEYYSLDEGLLDKLITPQTKAVIAAHLHGQMCAIDHLKAVCDEKGIYLIEDCAQAHFSELNGVRAGLTGIAGSFSFYPGKNLGAYGDAGCIISNDDQLAQKCRMYAQHGGLKKHQHYMEGINSRMDGIQAAILSAKLPYVLEWTEKRIHHAARYTAYLSDIPEVAVPKIRPKSKHTYHVYIIRAQRRDALSEYLHQQGIETSIHYPVALPNLPAYQYLGHQPSEFPIATRLTQEILSLPMYPELTDDQAGHVAESIRHFYRSH